MKALNFIADKYFNYQVNRLCQTPSQFLKTQDKLWKKTRSDLKGTRLYENLKLEHLITYDSYAKHLDVVDWDFYGPYVEAIINGDKNVLFRDEIECFGLTSGTSGKDSKRIPYNGKMIKSFLNAQKYTASIVSTKSNLNMLSASRLTFGSSPVSYSDGEFNYGYISGILSTKTPDYLQKNTYPSSKTLHIENWDEKVESIIAEAIDKDIEVISGIPTYIITILETILKKKEIKSISEIWPNLKAFVYGATPIVQYKDRIDELVGKKLDYFGIYAATEAAIGIPYNEKTYIPNPDILYSFTSFDSENEQLSVKDLQVGKKYFINIGTPNGFLNYSMKDIIEIVSLDKVIEFEICGRQNTGMNLAAEKVSDQQILETISKARVDLGLDIRHFFVSPQMIDGRPNYLWTLFLSDVHDKNKVDIAKYLDDTLRVVCDDYNDCRVEKVISTSKVDFKSLGVLQKYFIENQSKGQFKMKTTFPIQSLFEQFIIDLEGVRA